MSVEIIDHEVPLADAGIGFDGGEDMGEKIRFVTGRASGNLPHSPSPYIEIGNEAERAMPFVLELPAQDVSREHGQIRMFARKGLYPGHFITTQGGFSMLCTRLGSLLQGIDVRDLLIRLR